MKVILLLCLALVSCNNLRGLASSTILTGILNKHNEYRAKHAASALTINTAIQTMAQNYANKLGSTNSFAHSNSADRKYNGASTGENLYMCFHTGSGCLKTGAEPVDKWYSDIADYNPANPIYSHFTQLVWKSTTQIGCGYADGVDGTWKTTVVVCNYYPAGNMSGKYGSNVQL